MTKTRHYFGTDGIRGTANAFPMTADIALKFGQATGSHFHQGDHRHKVVIGKDTRLSGYMVEPALTAGFVSVGMDVVLVGPMPTPAVAMLTRSLRADLGVMISASHNPYHDNGIKLFDRTGLKLSDDVQNDIEARINGNTPITLAQPDHLGRATRLDDAPGRYIEFAKHTFPKRKTLDGLKIVIDAANGAAYSMASKIFWELEAEVITLGGSPDGFNINHNCGAMHPETLCDAVREHQADIGIALDGDADRLVVCDEKGQVVDGDHILGLIAKHQYEQGTLEGNGLVVTTMSNMGLERYLSSLNLSMHRTGVGDRHVASYMREHGFNVGGEPSGHIILRDYTTTGDGIIAALQLLAILIESDAPASDILHPFELYPQILRNVRYGDVNPLDNDNVKACIAECEAKLGNKGRLILRPSGTEPLIRIMAEGEDASLITTLTDTIANALEEVIST